jgi:hypothetical protein
VRKAIISGVLIGLLLVTSLLLATAETAQASLPVASRFTFHYPSGSPGNGVDTTVVDSGFATYVGEAYAGYYDIVGNNWGANIAVYNHMPVDAIFSFVGHGKNKGGYLLFWNGSSYSSIKANNGMPNWYTSYSLNYVSDLWDVRLMVLTACLSDNRYNLNDWYTSLTEEARYLGVDCTVGFQDLLVVNRALNWDYYFWYYAGGMGYSVGMSCNNACAYVYYIYGDWGGTNEYEIRGPITTMIKPAAYGS